MLHSPERASCIKRIPHVTVRFPLPRNEVNIHKLPYVVVLPENVRFLKESYAF
jgi:hypothetical protein